MVESQPTQPQFALDFQKLLEKNINAVPRPDYLEEIHQSLQGLETTLKQKVQDI